MKLPHILIVATLGLSSAAFAQQEDPFRDAFFPPEMVFHFAEELGLSEEEQKKFHEELQSRKPAFEEANGDLKLASEALAKTMDAHPVDASVALQKLQAVLAAENAMKKLHLEAMISIRNQLTPDQIAKIDELKRQPNPNAKHAEFIKANIQPKIAQFQEAMRDREAAQNPPPEEVPQLMQKFQALMKEGDVENAAKTLDEVLALVK